MKSAKIHPLKNAKSHHEKQLGYVMTAAPAQPGVALEECVSEAGGRPDYQLSVNGCAAPYRHRRAAGFVYRDPQPGSEALYECRALEGHFASTDASCEGLGSPVGRLGYLPGS